MPDFHFDVPIEDALHWTVEADTLAQQLVDEAEREAVREIGPEVHELEVDTAIEVIGDRLRVTFTWGEVS